MPLGRAVRSGYAVEGVNCLRSFERWGRGFEFHSRNGCLSVCLFILFVLGSGLAIG
jgi:hypothetical protein